MKAIRNRVIINPEPVEEKTKGGIIIPKKEQPTKGVVISAGNNEWGIKDGDVVLYNKWNTDPLKQEGTEYVSVLCKDVVAIITK